MRIFLTAILLFSVSAFSQNAPGKVRPLTRLRYADAKNAIEIEDSVAGPYNVSLGHGAKMEVSEKFPPNTNTEDNSIWFKFTARHDTLLSFDIVPIDSMNDYDFVLFRYEKGDSSTGKEKFINVRSCWSQCFSKSGLTGISRYAIGNHIPAGNGPAYASSLNVKAGEVYYLMVNYGQMYMGLPIPPKGFNIYFYDHFPKRKAVVLENIYFESGSSVLKSESFPELDKLVVSLKGNSAVVEIRGHTDNQGDEKKNLELSQDRAKAVAEYLISKGIVKQRVFFKGFGSSKPIAPNTTKEERQKNRRVEFVKVLY